MLGKLHSKMTVVSTLRTGAKWFSPKFLVTAILLCALPGCSPSNPEVTGQQQSPESQKAIKQPLSYYEATLDPSQYEDDVEAVQKRKTLERDTTQLQIPKDSVVVQESSQLGFRIQIYSTANIDEAMNMRTNILAKLPRDSVYVEYDPPVYKVRLGDFPSRYEASTELPSIVNMGYPDAWIVPDNIVRRKVIQIPR